MKLSVLLVIAHKSHFGQMDNVADVQIQPIKAPPDACGIDTLSVIVWLPFSINPMLLVIEKRAVQSSIGIRLITYVLGNP